MKNSKGHILIVDDDEINVQLMSAALKDSYSIDAAYDGHEALRIVALRKPDLILLDVMMPGLTGFEVCRILKSDEATSRIPVIFLTAMDDAENEMQGLNAGGIDYITKPVNIDLVRLRIRNHIDALQQRRALPVSAEQPAWRLSETESRLYTPHGIAVTLTSRECILLRTLLATPGGNVHFSDIFAAFGQQYDVYTKLSLEVLVSRLRAKVDKASPNCSLPIKSRRNIGYIFLDVPSDMH